MSVAHELAPGSKPRRRVLMVAPRYFDVVYEINPWMSRARRADPARASAEWESLRRVLTEKAGAEVLTADPQPGLPDLVFTANAGLVLGERAVLSNFRHPERQAEAPHFRRWFEAHGFEVLTLPEERLFEGEGDALFAGDTLFAGYHFRSDVLAHRAVGELLGVRVISLELTDPYFYHLDTCFCPLDAETVAYYPPAFDEYARRVIEADFPRRIEVEHVALNTGCPGFESALRNLGFIPHATPTDEFLKAGGSAKCLVLHLDHPGLRPASTSKAPGIAAARR
jgi:N-dimethylarginine dimethylaminohydrolase